MTSYSAHAKFLKEKAVYGFINKIQKSRKEQKLTKNYKRLIQKNKYSLKNKLTKNIIVNLGKSASNSVAVNSMLPEHAIQSFPGLR